MYNLKLISAQNLKRDKKPYKKQNVNINRVVESIRNYVNIPIYYLQQLKLCSDKQ